MELIRGISRILPKHQPCVMTIGKFDGVHLGHQQIIRRLHIEAKERQLPVAVMIFEPQPQEFFAQRMAPTRLTPFRDKFRYLAELGVDYLLCVKFDRQFSQLSAQQFIDDILVNKLNIQYLLVGDDFTFGYQQQANIHYLSYMAKLRHFRLSIAPACKVNGQRVSSTAIRHALQQGNLDYAKQLLGRTYSLTGKVVHGRALGRLLGFPTANIALNWNQPLLKGVIAVKVCCDGYLYYGVANFGQRPTINGDTFLLEVHLIDFNANLYGKQLEIMLCHKLRDERRFASLDDLKQQILQDVKLAKHYFNLS